MRDAEAKLLFDMLRDAYADINPELTDRGAHLVRSLADGMYRRGARVMIGAPQPDTFLFIHHSLDPLGNVLWTGRRWNQVLGYHAQAPVGKHISAFIEPGSFKAFEECWPRLVAEGRVENVPIILVTSTGEYLNATAKSEILRDETGGFLRTFAKLKVRVPAALARMAS